MDNSRPPNWGKWKHVLETTILEATALSLNIDPTKVRAIKDKFTGDIIGVDESKKFKDRLFLATRRAAAKGGGFTLRGNVVRLSEFATLAISLSWDVPSEFSELAETTDQSEIQNHDDNTLEKPLGERERVTLLVIIAALAKALNIEVSHRGTAAAQIESKTELIGARVPSRTIQEHLKRIPEALGKRKE
jgi:hypothetical protein